MIDVVILATASDSAIRKRSERMPQTLFVASNGNMFGFDGAIVRTTPQCRNVLVRLLSHPDALHSKGELFDVAFLDDINGGPLFAESRLSQLLCEARIAAAAIGFKIVTDWGHGYRVRPIADCEAA